MDFVLGTAFLVPGPHQLPLAAGLVAFKGIQGLRHRQRLRRSASSSGGLQAPPASNEVMLEWRDLTCTLTNKKTGAKRRLLNGVAGGAAPGRLTAIMGPSGSGKTTLLSALAGQMPYNSAITLQGQITTNGAPLQRRKLRAGFVQQDDLFYPQLTVKETLMMAAELRMSRDTSAEEKEGYVDGIIARLGLAKAANTPVGDAKTRGLSGGEKKRLSIAVELINRPMLVFADEPTSGLDAFSAEMVMTTLKDLCSDGHTVLVSIHQPRSSVFTMFDDLILLAEGELVYSGPAADALPYFEQHSHTCPKHYNPAEWLADLVAIDHTSPENEAESGARVAQLTAAWRAHAGGSTAAAAPASGEGASGQSASGEGAGGEGDPSASAVESSGKASCGVRKQVSLLFKRSLRQVLRDRATNVGRASSQVSSALVFASIYWRLKRSQSTIQDRMGLLQISAVGTAMTSLIKTLNVFPREKMLVSRERARAGYGVLPYLLSKLAAELPVGALFPALFACIVYPATGLNPKPRRFASFLGLLTLEAMSAQALGLAVGAAAPSTEAALAIGPAVILVSIVFGGLFVNKANVPTPLKWLPATSLIKQAFEGACINEFKGAEFDPDERGGGSRTGEDVLERLSFADSDIGRTMANQGRIMLAYYWYCYCILVRKQPKYQPLLPPSSAA